MLRRFLKAKIHRARITQTDLHYVGSLTLDRNLMDAADIRANEAVDVYNINNGSRFTTYVIEGERGKGEVCVNGAAAHLANVDDLVIIATYCDLTEEEMEGFEPVVLQVDEHNQPR